MTNELIEDANVLHPIELMKNDEIILATGEAQSEQSFYSAMLQPIKISKSPSGEDLAELGTKAPYHRFVTFPIEVKEELDNYGKMENDVTELPKYMTADETVKLGSPVACSDFSSLYAKREECKTTGTPLINTKKIERLKEILKKPPTYGPLVPINTVHGGVQYFASGEATKFLECKKLHEDATIPTKAHETDAAFDLYALENKELWGITPKVRTGIAINIPTGYVGIIKDRSSMGAKRISVLGGVIDAGYTGEINVMLEPHTGYYSVKKGDKIAQLILLELPKFIAKEVTEFSNNYSDRKEKGFGSSGQ